MSRPQTRPSAGLVVCGCQAVSPAVCRWAEWLLFQPFFATSISIPVSAACPAGVGDGAPPTNSVCTGCTPRVGAACNVQPPLYTHRHIHTFSPALEPGYYRVCGRTPSEEGPSPSPPLSFSATTRKPQGHARWTAVAWSPGKPWGRRTVRPLFCCAGPPGAARGPGSAPPSSHRKALGRADAAPNLFPECRCTTRPGGQGHRHITLHRA